MAKAILKYDLNDEDDNLQFQRAAASDRLALALWHITSNTHKRIIREMEAAELRGEPLSGYDVLEKTFEEIGEILNRYDITPDSLTH